MDIIEANEKFLRFENENKLFEHKIKGVKWWEYARFRIFNEMILKTEGILGNSDWSRLSLYDKLKIPIRMLKNSIFRNPLIGLKKSEIFAIINPWRVKENGVPVEIYMERAIRSLPHSIYMVEHVDPNGAHTQSDFSKNIKYLDCFTLFKVLLEPLMPDVYRKNKEFRDIISEIETLFDFRFDDKFIRYIDQYIKYLIIEVKLFSRFYKYILRRVNPKILIETNSYFMVHGVFNKTAKELGIKVAEFQHGTMGRYHLAYNFLKHYKIDSFPDYIFLFGDFWKNTTRFPLPKENLIPVGFPNFEKKLNLYEKESGKYGNKKVVLFISQGPISKQMSQFACGLDKIIDRQKFHIIYKLHPHEYAGWQESLPWLVGSGIEVADTDKDIYYHFKQADYQVGVYSTAIYEGLGFGLVTFVLKLYGLEYIEALCENGYVQVVDTPEEMNAILNSGNFEVSNPNLQDIWKLNSIENTLEAIEKLIGEK